MYLEVNTDIPFDIPVIQGIPESYFLAGKLDDCITDLGFKEKDYKWQMLLTSSEKNVLVSIVKSNFQYVIFFNPENSPSSRTIFCSDDFALLLDISGIEMLCIITQWWQRNISFTIPHELQLGLKYAQNLEELKAQIVPLPSITIERDILRFYINKLKNDEYIKDNDSITLYLENNLLKISAPNKCYAMTIVKSQGIEKETIKIKMSAIKNQFPKRFYNDECHLSLSSKGLWCMPIEWDGASLEDMELPYKHLDYLNLRLMRRTIMIY